MSANPTIEAYNTFAALYDQEVIDFWNQFPQDFLQQLSNHAQGKNILDVGSGSGRDALLLRDMGFNVTCQDGSKSMVAMTEKLGFTSVLADFASITFPAESFDGIWAYTSLIHLPKDEAKTVIQNLRRLLKKDGVFVMGAIEGTDAGMVERRSMPGARRYFKRYTRHELQELIEPAGFKLLLENVYKPHNNRYINQLYKAS